MDDWWKKDFKTIGKSKALKGRRIRTSNGIYIQARDERYRGFFTLLLPDTNIDDVYRDYEAFKELVDSHMAQRQRV